MRNGSFFITIFFGCLQNGNRILLLSFDHQGNTIALSDRTGTIVQTYAYDAWGKILKETGSIDPAI